MIVRLTFMSKKKHKKSKTGRLMYFDDQRIHENVSTETVPKSRLQTVWYLLSTVTSSAVNTTSNLRLI